MERISINYFRSLPMKDCDEDVARGIVLFRAVIDQMTEDMIATPRTGEDEHAKRAAELWLSRKVPHGFYHAPFDEVCDMAELPIHFVQNRMRAMIACMPSE